MVPHIARPFFFSALILLVSMPCMAVGQGKGKTTTKEPQMTPSKRYAVLETSMGTFEIELYQQDAPKAVENFVRLASTKFFDGMRIHRVAKGFVIQTGDEKSKDRAKIKEWGTGGRSIWGKEFQDELDPNTPSYKEGYTKGVVAMANHGPNTNSSQFFVMLQDNMRMPKNYTIFGKVIKGQDVVDKIGEVDIEPGFGPTDGRPKVDVMVRKVTVRK